MGPGGDGFGKGGVGRKRCELPLAGLCAAWAILPRPVQVDELVGMGGDAGIAEGVLGRLHVVQRVLRPVCLVCRLLVVESCGSVENLVVLRLDGGAKTGPSVFGPCDSLLSKALLGEAPGMRIDAYRAGRG